VDTGVRLEGTIILLTAELILWQGDGRGTPLRLSPAECLTATLHGRGPGGTDLGFNVHWLGRLLTR
jgi:hypothetical protein